MSKTTPEEAKALAEKHNLKSQEYDRLANIIDEVRGVHVQPVAWLFEGPQGLRQLSMTKDFTKPVLDLHKKMAQEQPDKYTLMPFFTHPAPSQPAAPVELPVVVTPSVEENLALRRMLGEQWCANQMVMYPYTDDGQFHDGSDHPGIDFINDSAAEIRRKMQTRLRAAIPAAKSIAAARRKAS